MACESGYQAPGHHAGTQLVPDQLKQKCCSRGLSLDPAMDPVLGTEHGHYLLQMAQGRVINVGTTYVNPTLSQINNKSYKVTSQGR